MYVGFLFSIFEGLPKFAYAAYGYAQLHEAWDIPSTSINYTGGGVGVVKATIPGIVVHNTKIVYSNCNLTASYDYGFLSRDIWMLLPKSVNGLGKLTFTLPGNYFPEAIIGGNDVYLYREPVRALLPGETGMCGRVGQVEHASIAPMTSPDVQIAVDVSTMPVGHYKGTLDLGLALAQYYDQDTRQVSTWWLNADTVTQHVEHLIIPYDIKITNRCTVSPVALTLEHGTLPRAKAAGNRRTGDVTVTCDEDGVIKMKLSATTASTAVNANAVGVSLGHGWNSELSMSTTEHPQMVTEIEQRVEKGVPARVEVTSMLTGDGGSETGELNGSAVLILDLE
ncbi:protein PapG [Escherichia coli]|nr:protein PapG [Escherichia coli]CAD6111272.1 protein PapG [Escherichia coli]CAD6181075.1 protein PapG [Escherichia coli]